MTEKRLTDDEAEEFLRLLEQVDEEIQERLETGDYDGAMFTTLIRRKYAHYIDTVYDVDSTTSNTSQ